MGNDYSTHNYPPEVVDVLDNIKTKITSKMSSTCNSSSSNTQTMTFGSIEAIGNCEINNSDIHQNMSTNINALCVQDDNFKNMLENTVAEELAELRKRSKPDLASKIKKIVDEEVNVEKVSKCMANSYNSQYMHFGNVKITCPRSGKVNNSNISQHIASDLVFTCVQGTSPDIQDRLENIEIKPSEKTIEPKEAGISDEMMIGVIVGSIVGFLLLLCFILGMVYLFKKPSV